MYSKEKILLWHKAILAGKSIFKGCSSEFTDLEFVKLQFVIDVYELLHLFHLPNLCVCLRDKLQIRKERSKLDMNGRTNAYREI